LIFVAVLLVAGMALLGVSFRSKLYAAAYSDSAWQARQLVQSLQSDLKLKAREVEARAAAAASLNPVRALVAHRVDRATLEDAFSTEDWWRSFREEFPIQILAAEGTMLNFSRDPAELNVDSLIASARRKSPASLILTANGKPYFIAAASVDVPAATQRGPTFLVLGRAFTAKDLAANWSEGSAAMLAYDGLSLFSAGAPEELQHLQDAVGKDASRPIVAPEAQWSAAAAELSPKLWLWASTDTSAKSREVSRTLKTVSTPLWSVTALLSLGCLYFAFRRRRAGPEQSDRREREREEMSVVVEPALAQEEGDHRRARAAQLPAGAPQPVVLSTVPNGPRHPNQFGRYRLLHALGKGTTMRADLAVLHGAEGFSRLFVIKRLLPELARQPSAVEEFVERAQLGSGLVHSNIVPIYDFGRVAEQYFIAQEHILGRDLQSVVRRERENDGKLLPALLVFFIAQEIAKALAYAHTRRKPGGEMAGVIHGNISPHKILISAMGEVKLLDFGIPHARARLTEDVSERAQFMSPEQARGDQMDERSDLFSLGLTMFWCLSGRSLYSPQRGPELLEKVRQGPGREEQDLINLVAGPATHILQRALEPSPDNRFQTAEEFARAIPPWEMTRAGERLQSMMRRLFENDFQDEQGRYADWQTGLEDLSISESEPDSADDIRRIGQSR